MDTKMISHICKLDEEQNIGNVIMDSGGNRSTSTESNCSGRGILSMQIENMLIDDSIEL